ncbi:hypothetical protein [Plantactinospora sp. DSM 117369]
MRALFSFAQTGFGDPVSALLGGVAAILGLLFLVVFLLELLVALIVTPFAWLARNTLGRPWPVLAHAKDLPGYSGTADGAAGARQLVDKVREEILRYGEPKSLTPAAVREASLSASKADSLPPWLGKVVGPIRRISRQQHPPTPPSRDRQHPGNR